MSAHTIKTWQERQPTFNGYTEPTRMAMQAEIADLRARVAELEGYKQAQAVEVEPCASCKGRGVHEIEDSATGNLEEWPCFTCTPVITVYKMTREELKNKISMWEDEIDSLEQELSDANEVLYDLYEQLDAMGWDDE